MSGHHPWPPPSDRRPSCQHCGKRIYQTNLGNEMGVWVHETSQFGGDRFCPPLTVAEPPAEPRTVTVDADLLADLAAALDTHLHIGQDRTLVIKARAALGDTDG